MFAEEWLPKAEILGPADEQTTWSFRKKSLIQSSYITLSKFTGAWRFREIEKEIIV